MYKHDQFPWEGCCICCSISATASKLPKSYLDYSWFTSVHITRLGPARPKIAECTSTWIRARRWSTGGHGSSSFSRDRECGSSVEASLRMNLLWWREESTYIRSLRKEYDWKGWIKMLEEIMLCVSFSLYCDYQRKISCIGLELQGGWHLSNRETSKGLCCIDTQVGKLEIA